MNARSATTEREPLYVSTEALTEVNHLPTHGVSRPDSLVKLKYIYEQ